METYQAIYKPTTGEQFPATVLFTSVTITIRYRDGQAEKEVYWLGDQVTALQARGNAWEMTYAIKEGVEENLLIEDEYLYRALQRRFRHQAFVGGWYYRLWGSLKQKVWLFTAVVVAFLLLGYFVFIPWLGEQAAMRISKNYEVSMGDQMYHALVADYSIDDYKTQQLNAFYQALQYPSGYPVSITVVQSDIVNAFAIPGGHIVVYTAILDKLQSADELAALLGHEASHVALRHSLRNMGRTMARKMFLSILLGNQAGIGGVLVSHADDLKGLQYSRKLETQADDNGLHWMREEQIDQQGMVQLMEQLQQETDGAEPAAFLSTHPVFTARIDHIREQIAQYPGTVRSSNKLDTLFQSLQQDY